MSAKLVRKIVPNTDYKINMLMMMMMMIMISVGPKMRSFSAFFYYKFLAGDPEPSEHEHLMNVKHELLMKTRVLNGRKNIHLPLLKHF